jgi:antitoxin MazE
MRCRVQKWGDSLALRIPGSFAIDSGLSQGLEVELSVEDGRLVVTPVVSWPERLDELLGQVDSDNAHPEVDTGGPVGNEFW